MKKAILALILTAAAATPAMAGGFRQGGAITPSPAFAYNETAKGKPYRAPTSIATYGHRQHVAGNTRHNATFRHNRG